MARTGATLFLSSSSFLYEMRLLLPRSRPYVSDSFLCCLTGRGERARIMPFVVTTAMTSEFPGVGVGPGVSDHAALSVVSPFSEFDIIPGLGVVYGLSDHVGRSVASPCLEPDIIPRLGVGPGVCMPQ